MNVLSLFDGMSCGQIALNRAGIKYENYYACEIDKYAIQVTQANYPKTIQLGCIKEFDRFFLPEKIDLLIGGSPCQGFSFAGKQLAFDDPRSKLFFEWVNIWHECKPEYWLLENVKMKKEHLKVITDILGVEPILINSALVSAQNRQRYYWTNIPNVTQPEDKGILLKDIIESGEVDRDKSYCIDANYYKGGNEKSYFDKARRQIVVTGTLDGGVWAKRHEQVRRVYGINGLSPTLSAVMGTGGGVTPKILFNVYPKGGQNGQVFSIYGKSKTLSAGVGVSGNGIGSSNAPKILSNDYTIRKLTPIECERLQTVPDNYTNHVSNTQRYKMLGNGWTVDVVAHILKNIKAFQ